MKDPAKIRDMSQKLEWQFGIFKNAVLSKDSVGYINTKKDDLLQIANEMADVFKDNENSGGIGSGRSFRQNKM